MIDSDKTHAIPLSVPCLAGNEKRYVNECLDTNWISSAGRFVGEFEKEFAKYAGSKYAVAVASGTAALHLALIVSGIKTGEEVFAPALTFIAPLNAIKYVGAYPVFIDSNQENLGISPEGIEEFIAKNCEFKNGKLINKLTSRTISGIVAVHIYGHSCEMEKIIQLKDKYNLKLIEDAAEGMGCLYKNKHVGTFAKTGCFSFNGNKIMTTGGGGMAVSDSKEIADRIRHLSTQAKTDTFYYRHDEIGYNYRMTNIQAAIGLGQLERFDEMLKRKREIHLAYQQAFKDIKGASLFAEQSYCRSNYWLALLFTEKREELFKFMEKRQIQTRPFWRLNHLHPMFTDCAKSKTPVDEKLFSSGVCIPCHAGMTDSDVATVIKTVKEFFHN